MKNLVMALMMLLVLGAGFLGSKYNLNEGRLNILESTNGTSDNLDTPKYVKEDSNKSKGPYQTVNNQKTGFKEDFEVKTENSTVINNSMGEVSNNESDRDLNNENEQEENNQSENET